MRPVALIVLLSIAAVGGDDKEKRFTVDPAASYPGHQTIEKITIAAIPYTSEDQMKIAFGKANPYKYGVLPVLVVLQNDTGKALRLDLQAEFVDPGNRHVEATSADDVLYIGASTKPPKLRGSSPYPNPFPHGPKKGPLNSTEIETRAFAAKMLPAGESAYGFFYFQTQNMPGSKLYLTGLKDATTGKDYFYFEIPLEKER
ncbi:MAG TPA: hypothetical protein VMG40_15925 [Bryobacteraceae bacterium]|nr:hypothetical protein [Bryobacteraceae bacterium]